MTPGMHEDSSEAGNISGSRFSYIIEAETRFGKHGTASGHPDGDVVAVVHLLLDVAIYLSSNIWLIRYLDMERMNPLGGTIVVFT